MSAKKVSKMCIFVHKLVEIARFSPRKVQKRGFFAGGRGDFLAGRKWGFSGSRASRAGHVARAQNGVPSPFPSTDFFINQKTFVFACATKTFRLVAL
jgi:hypothetical protein